MSKKLSGAENRKRKALRELKFQKSKRSMDVTKYLIPNEKVNLNVDDLNAPSTSNSENKLEDIDKENEESKQGESENYSNCENSCAIEFPENEIESCDNAFKESSETTILKNSTAEQGKITSDLSDPALWPNNIDKKLIDHLILQGPVTALINKYPCDKNGRHFSEKYFSRQLPNNEVVKRRWLIYSKSSDTVFCFCCFLFDRNSKSALANKGFCDWNHLSLALKEHENSSNHKKCYVNWMEAENRLKTKRTIDEAEQLIILKEAMHWNNVLERLMNIILYLTENNMAMRGSSDKLYTPNNGKYLSLIQLLAKFDPVMQEHINRILRGELKDHYCGKDIANELLALMATEVNRYIILKIQESKYFSIIADCTPDISHTEQLSLIVRYVNFSKSDVEISESFLEFLPISDSTGKGLSNSILSILEKYNISLNNCRGQGYDNGANMKGRYNGVQKQILDKNPLAFFLPCGCHSLNLVLCDAAKSSIKSSSLFGILGRLYSLFSASVKRWEILLSHVKSFTLKRLSDTRWEAKVDSVKAVRYQISSVHDALVTLAEAETNHDKAIAHEAFTLAEQIKNFSFLVSLVLWYDILFQVNIVSKSMQKEKIDITKSASLLKNLLEFLEEYKRNGFSDAISSAKELANELQIEPVFKNDTRVRRVKRQFDYESQDEQIESPQRKFEIEFFNTLLDTLLVSLKERFIQFNEHSMIWNFLYDLNNVPCKENLLQQCKKLESSLTFNAQPDINAISLYQEILSIQVFLKNFENPTPLQVLNLIRRNSMEDLYPNIWIALRILLTMPVTVASGERSFSKLKLIKTYLRSTLSQDNLNYLAILSIEKETAKMLNFKELIKKFANLKARKVNFFT